jgi:hypothetical protein
LNKKAQESTHQADYLLASFATCQYIAHQTTLQLPLEAPTMVAVPEHVLHNGGLGSLSVLQKFSLMIRCICCTILKIDRHV